MRRFNCIVCILAVLVVFLLSACDTYTLMPTHSRTAPPPATGPRTGPPSTPPSPVYRDQMSALEARVQNLESRLAELEQARVTPMAPPAPVPETPAAPEVVAPPPSKPEYPSGPQVEDKTFNEGMGLYRDKKFEAARGKFYQYLKNQPRGPKAPEARYYLADSFYQDKRYREAAVEYNKLVNLHSASVLAPSALLRQALSYEQLQQRNNYQITLKKLATNYPNSPEAREARKRLGDSR
jgi:tol-pal system protein YbgF